MDDKSVNRRFRLSPEVTVTLLWSPVENSSLLTSVDVSSFSANLMELRTMLVTLCFQKVNCTSSHGLVLVTVNWNSFAVLFFCTSSQHSYLLFG
jgi:hypothetical protein